MPWAKEPTLEGNQSMAARDEKAWSEDRFFHFALVEKGTGLPLGVAGLNRNGPEECELHYWIRTSHAGRGLTTEAGSALIAWARDVLKVRRLTLWAGQDNHASRRVAEKLGFIDQGPLSWRPEGGLGDFDAEGYELRLSS